MRKIEKEMIAAIRAGADRKLGNTEVRNEGGFSSVYLHGSLIAREMADKSWKFNLCGWNTPTTRSRLNALAREFGRPGVYNTAGKPYLDDRECTPVPLTLWF